MTSACNTYYADDKQLCSYGKIAEPRQSRERIDGLKPWSILLGDERDEKPSAPLKVTIKENKHIKTLQT